jgi:hypothetical protein
MLPEDNTEVNSPHQYLVYVWEDSVLTQYVWADSAEIKDGALCFYRHVTIIREAKSRWPWRMILHSEVQKDMVASFTRGEWISFGMIEEGGYGIIDVTEIQEGDAPA